ncbi:hypothetical protein BDA96_02G248300 [Sorghum bicolor]|uniref:WIYLD domain-containing protein n=1 Tax=Sorghum bicolor TaxID=4558 RepID=A0A921RQM6_SORBI|nr:hypothetical protein BDA96_02G248300 [Sorghum bicolor]
MPTRRPRKGGRRIDAAVDHFVLMGYAAYHVRSVVGSLVKMYGGPSRDVWRLVEEDSYKVVEARLLAIKEEKQKEDGQQVEDEPPKGV